MQGRRAWARIARADSGATAVEYGLLIAGVAILVIPALAFLRSSTTETFRTTVENEDGVTVCAPGDPNCSAFNALPAANIPGVPIVTTLAATAVGATGATLNGTVNANGTPTAITFCIGTAPDLTGCTVVNGSPATATGSTVTGASAVRTGLSTNTTYYYRVIGTSTKGTRFGATLSFVTGSAGSSAPTATTVAATAVASTSATLNGFVVPGGSSTNVTFCYGMQRNLNSCTSTNAVPATVTGTSGTAVSLALTGLQSNRQYYFRVAAANGLGTDAGGILSFTTGAAVVPPTATTSAASAVTATSATLNGTVGANGTDRADIEFCYGTVPSLAADCSNGTLVADSTLNRNDTSQAVSYAVTGLSSASTYYFRVLATNQGNGVQALGSILSFTTPAIVPTVTTTSPATGISTSGATVAGTVNANGGSFTTAFCFGPTTPLAANCSNGQSRVAAPSPVTGTGATAVSLALTGLNPSTTYYFRTDATSGGVTTSGAERSFTTTSLPTVTTSSASPVAATSATLRGTINANGGSYTTAFCYGTTNPLAADCSNGTRVGASPASATGTTATSTSAAVSGLQPGTTYYVRALAESGGTTTAGTQVSFTTTCALVISLTNLGSSPQTVNVMSGVTGGNLTAAPVKTPGENANTGTVALSGSAPTPSVRWSGYSGNKTWTGTIAWSSARCSAGTGSLSLGS